MAEQTTFVDRRQGNADQPVRERRQFTPSYDSARVEVNEMAKAIDEYKMRHRRRFITFEELYDVIAGLGYHK
ncbi:MAG: hypothetical protein R3B90_17025 [Planctomycetaceae bacterium]